MQRSVTGLAVLAACAVEARAQELPPPRPAGPVEAKAAAPFASITAVHPLPHGRLLVNDNTGRRLVLLDSSLALLAVVADTTAATGAAYRDQFGALIPYRGDSALLTDRASMSMLVIGPAGERGRVIAMPRPQDTAALVGASRATAALPNGGLVYLGRFSLQLPPRGPLGLEGIVSPSDTQPVLRVDFGTRRADTLAFLRREQMRLIYSTDSTRRQTIVREMNPLPTVDEWAVLADGTVAIVRGRDYHVDWIRPDGSRASSPKIAFPWRPFTEQAKALYLDAQRGRVDSVNAAARAASTGPGGMLLMGLVDPSVLPDHLPAFYPGAVLADPAGRLWVRTTRATGGGLIYDVIDRTGAVVEQVQLPAGRWLVAVGAQGDLYLASGPVGATTLERVSAR